MKKILILIITLLIISCTSKAEFTNRAYLDVDRVDGINAQEAIAIADYYFQYKQSAFEKSGSVYIERKPEELKDNWKFRIISKTENVNINVSYLVSKKDGQVKETSD